MMDDEARKACDDLKWKLTCLEIITIGILTGVIATVLIIAAITGALYQ